VRVQGRNKGSADQLEHNRSFWWVERIRLSLLAMRGMLWKIMKWVMDHILRHRDASAMQRTRDHVEEFAGVVGSVFIIPSYPFLPFRKG